MENTPETKVRKRKQRAILSCNDCRRRKLKCDRELPCNRCINGGIAEKCAYGSDAHFVDYDCVDMHPTKQARQSSDQPSQRSAEWTTQQHDAITEHRIQPNTISEKTADNTRVQQLESRIATLESLLSDLQDKSEHHAQLVIPPENGLSEEISTITSAGLFKGRDYRTFYYGPTSTMTIVAHFPDLRPFMKRVYIGSNLERLRHDSKWTEDKARMNKASSVLSVPNMRALLPDRFTVDKVVQTYFDTFETTYRILHTPTFWAAYRTYWDAPHASNSEMDALVLAILACTLCTSTHATTRYDTNGSTFRSKAIVWIKACEAWLRRHSNKHRTLASLQVRCLRLLALSTTCLKTKEYYQEVQQHLGFMRSCGMHRDPSILGSRCSVFEGELRRRLWAASLELELQASIDKGTSSILSGLQYDCAPPRNLNDSDLYIQMKYLPASQPTSVFTDTSFLHCSMQSTSLRVRLCALANAIQPKIGFQQTLDDEQAVQKAIERIPVWTEPHSLQARTLLDLQLRQFLVIGHTHRVLNTQIRSKPDFRYSVLACLEASTILVELHMNLFDKGNFALCCIRSDYLRAALLVCHIAYHASLALNSTIARVAKLTFDEIMDKSLRLLKERSMRPGRGNHQYWFVSAAASLVGIQYDPSRKQVLERQAADRVCKLLYRILSLQDDPLEESFAQEIILGDDPVYTPPPVNPPIDTSTFQLPDSFANQAPQLGSFDDGTASGWMLDDFWFMDDFPSTQLNEKFDFRFLDGLPAGIS